MLAKYKNGTKENPFDKIDYTKLQKNCIASISISGF